VSGFLKKNWIHILIWGAMFLYLLVARGLRTQFYLDQGKPVRVETSHPREEQQVEFVVDSLDQTIVAKEAVYRLMGWAFSTTDPTKSPDQYEREIILISDEKVYIFPTDTVERQGVQDTFQELNMDLLSSGYSTLIAKDVLPIGEYRVGILFRDPSTGQEYYTDKPRVILDRTPNSLELTN
jgi:hypothetical protein